MMNKETKRGRPNKYSDKELKTILYKFSKEYDGPLNYSVLEKKTGIPRHVWMRRMKATIDNLNNSIVASNTQAVESLSLPDISKVIEEYKSQPDLLSEKLYHWNEVIHSLQEKIQKQEKELSKIDSLQEKIILQEKQLNQQRKTINHYESIILDSSNPLYRRENNLQHNIVSIDSKNKEKATSFDFKKQFPALFTE